MSDTTTTWPDRADIVPCAIHPGQYFDDSELRDATFARGSLGRPLFWSGGQATVLQAIRGDGTKIAVRFVHHKDDEARTRYDALSNHLSAHRVPSMVHTQWLARGLRVNGTHYPILKMEWIEGTSLDVYVNGIVKSATAPDDLRTIADVWRQNCQELMQAGMSHGDIHAGNAMVTGGASRVGVRLVDYDNVWVPRLQVPCKEAGNAAFQHPRRRHLQDGPFMDAFPNTLTYLSLIGLASDPGLWPSNKDDPDDTLLFHKEDLDTPSSQIWASLRTSRDMQVRSLANLVLTWLGDAPDRFRGLEDVIAATQAGPSAPRPGANRNEPRNVWPPRTMPPGPGQARPGPLNDNQWPRNPAAAHPPGQSRQHNRPTQPTFGRHQASGQPGASPAQTAAGGQGLPGQQRWTPGPPPPNPTPVAGPPPPSATPVAGPPPPPPPVRPSASGADRTGGSKIGVLVAVVAAVIVFLVLYKINNP